MITRAKVDLDMSLQACVTRGAALLDDMRPGWRVALQGEDIRMTEGAACVAGRVFGDWREANVMVGDWLSPGRAYAGIWTMQEHGFIVSDNYGCQDEDATEALLPLWQAEINRP